jgi:putative endonuclease
MRWPWNRKPAGEGDERHRAGEWGEEQAARMLMKKGYRILGRRVTLGRREELDIVARHEDTLVFVEVKTRKSEDFGRPIESLDRAKRRAQSRAALRYLNKLKQKPSYFRFDVVEVVGSESNDVPVIRHVESAFTLDRGRRVGW